MHTRLWGRKLAAIGTAAIMAGCLSAAFADDDHDARVTFKFIETLKVREQQTHVSRPNGSLTERTSSEAGTVRLDASAPLNGEPMLDPSTPISVTAGSFALRTTLAADPDYRTGMHKASIVLTRPSKSGKSAEVYGHATISWNAKWLKLHVDGTIPGVSPVCARDFAGKTANFNIKPAPHNGLTLTAETGAENGEVTTDKDATFGETHAFFEVGPISARTRVEFRTSSTTRTVNGGRYVDSGAEWKYINASPGEMAEGQRTAHETTITVTGQARH